MVNVQIQERRGKSREQATITCIIDIAHIAQSSSFPLPILRSFTCNYAADCGLDMSFNPPLPIPKHNPAQEHTDTAIQPLLSPRPTLPPALYTMPFFVRPFFRKPFKLFAIDADTGQPIDPNVRRKTRVTYYELQNGSNGSKKLVAHKSASAPPAGDGEAKKDGNEATADDKPKSAAKEEAKEKKDGGGGEGGKAQQKGDDVPWTTKEDEKFKALKAEGITWKPIIEAMEGRSKKQLQARWNVIDPNKGNDQAKKDEGVKKENEGGEKQAQGQGKQNKKGNKGGGDNQQNNKQNQNQKKNHKNDKNNNNNDKNQPQPKTEQKDKPKSEAKPASSKPKPTNNDETHFTLADWLTLQEDDIFSFGELQCLSELIGRDANQSWNRIAAKFFDLTGRRVHPDDVREKFERMAAVAEGGK